MTEKCIELKKLVMAETQKLNKQHKENESYWLPVASKVDITAVETAKQQPDRAVEHSSKNFQYKRHSCDNRQHVLQYMMMMRILRIINNNNNNNNNKDICNALNSPKPQMRGQ